MIVPTKPTGNAQRRGVVIPFPSSKGAGDQPVRKVITPSKNGIRTAFPSTKAGGSNDCESGLESRAAAFIEVSPGVSGWACQPLKLSLQVNGSIHEYTPDFKITLRSGRVIIIEVKPLSDCLRDDVRPKLVAAHHYFDCIGWKFIILTEKDLGTNDYYQNLNVLRYYLRVPVAHERRVKARKYVSDHGFLSFIELERLGFDKPTIYSLLVNEALATDLSISLNPYSPITLPEESDHEACLFKGRSALDLA
jgi:TnsA endonuclease N terminal